MIDELCQKYLLEHDIDAVGYGRIDFQKEDILYKTFLKNEESKIVLEDKVFFDLASVTKVLSNGVFFLNDEDKISDELIWLLEHRAGLPAWGLLSKDSWKKDLMAYSLKESDTLYSDYSCLRFMLEWEKLTGKTWRDVLPSIMDEETLWWKDLSLEHQTVQNGYVRGLPNFSYVHDPNAFNLNEFTSHAGFFSTVSGLGRTLLNINKKYQVLDRMLRYEKKQRFLRGWDTVEGQTLAGPGCSERTFGHLGFTGTSIWIDPEKKIGIILLTNSTKHYWFDRKDLNDFRKNVGEILWSIS